MSQLYLLFDVGGTDIKAGISSAEGELLQIVREPTLKVAPELAAESIINQLGALARTLGDSSGLQPAAAGLAVCGLVDAPAGLALYSANLGWRNAPLQNMAADQLGMPVGFGHDVAMAAKAELELGSGAADESLRRNSAVLIIGTGIASALVVDGRMLNAGGCAGELGHTPVPAGLPCACGAIGCLETVASAGAIARRYAEPGTAKVGAKEVFAARAAGDPKARQVIGEAVEALAFVLAQLCASTAPETIILGGGLAQAGPPFFAEVQAALDQRLSFHRRPRLVPAQLGADAGLRGAWLLARQAAAKLEGQGR